MGKGVSKMSKELKVGDEEILDGRKYIVTAIQPDGNYVFETPWEIARRMRPPMIGNEVILDGDETPHYITKIMGLDIELKTWKEIYDERICKGCKFFEKETGWFNRERIHAGQKMRLCFGCKLGQFKMTHNVMDLPKECKARNYKYHPTEPEVLSKDLMEIRKKYGPCTVIRMNMFGNMETVEIK
jgi:hypothetical protein